LPASVVEIEVRKGREGVKGYLIESVIVIVIVIVGTLGREGACLL
jgi:hypothetical protein